MATATAPTTQPVTGNGRRAFPKSVSIDDIKVADRFRKDTGDLASLKNSIERLGLLHPLVVTEDLQLISGERRITALRDLGWDQVPVNVMSDLDTAARLLEAERDENVERLDMAPTEKAALAAKLKPLEAAEAKERERAGKANPPSKLGGGSSGETRDRIAKAVGWSKNTLANAEEVVAAVGDPDPAVARVGREAVAEMDATGKVSPAARKVREAKSRKGGAHAKPNIPELIGTVGDMLKKADVALAKFEKAADGNPSSKAVCDKASEYAGIADGLAVRLRKHGPRRP